ncbi:MAG TPA: ribosome small subunit-dependent GTPase A [Bacteroidia bacterium]|nr:ribosome small subunit-dependent GTPase A [Bacteroidia bacterium]
MRALILKSTGNLYRVCTDAGDVLMANLAGKIRLDFRKSTNPVVVGDYVEIEQSGESALITKIYPRKNYIIRKSLNLSKQTHILAANIDQAFLLATLVFPRTSTGFIDRFLVTTEAYQIPAKIIFNKVDLLDKELRNTQKEMIDMYTSIGYECIEISALKKEDVTKIKSKLKNKITLLAGHSGAGKSTLVNSIQPGLHVKTGNLSEIHLKGKHTTTFSELHKLDAGGYIIDTPGIKELGLVEMKKEEVGHYFPEFRALMHQCKFNNCTHTNEPHCAVLKALEEGKIYAERYHNYLGILNSEETNWTAWENK